MALKIYKPGQGYWTRMVSGLAGGVLVLVAAFWVWEKIESYSLPYGTYIQAGVAAAMVAIGGLLIYRWVAVKPSTSDFLIATEGEMKKVNWPARREVVGSTWIVICFLALLIALLYFADIVFSLIFHQVGVLEVGPFG